MTCKAPWVHLVFAELDQLLSVCSPEEFMLFAVDFASRSISSQVDSVLLTGWLCHRVRPHVLMCMLTKEKKPPADILDQRGAYVQTVGG